MATVVGPRLESPPATAPGGAVLRAGAAMDLGRRVDQEDALGLVQPGDSLDSARGSLFVLADGLGGHAAGELASRLAVQQIVQSYYSAPARQPGNLLQSAIAAAHSRVRVAAVAPGRQGMGTTCVCAAVQGDRLWVANVGDSRAYLVRPSEGVLQLTEDHSLAAEQVRQGVLTPEAALASPLRNVLIQSLGTTTPPQPYFAPPLHLHRGDLVLLCSDGLYGALEPPALRDYLLAALTSMREVQPDLLARDLLAAALFHGAEDNLSALVICCTAILPPGVTQGQAPARRFFLPAPPEPDSAPMFAPEEPPPAESALERAVWDSAEATPATPAAPAPAPGPPGLDAGPGRQATLGLPRPSVPQTQIALGVLGLLGLLLLAGSIVVAPFSALWIGLLLGLILIAGLLLFVVAFLPPALDAPPRPRTAAALPALPAERGWGDGSPPDLASRPLIADLLERVLPGPPAPWRAGEAPADRALPAPPGVPPPPASATPPPPEVAVPSYVNQAFSDALERARHQWTFNLLVAFGTAGLIVVGIAISVTWVLSGESTVWAVLLGPGATLVGVLNWLLTRPAAQLSRADNQISLLSLVWTSYAQELRSCTAMPDPAAAAACTGRAGADAVNYFNAILSHPDSPAPPPATPPPVPPPITPSTTPPAPPPAT